MLIKYGPFRPTRNSQIILNKLLFYISQHFGNRKLSDVLKVWDINLLKSMLNSFENYLLTGPKQSSISIVLNKNEKQDGGISVNLE